MIPPDRMMPFGFHARSASFVVHGSSSHALRCRNKISMREYQLKKRTNLRNLDQGVPRDGGWTLWLGCQGDTWRLSGAIGIAMDSIKPSLEENKGGI